MAKKSYLTFTDQFCGAGGSSSGAEDAGAEVLCALNHWERAIETYQTNHQNTLVDCTDISACDPRRYPSTDVLITSPECTNHSLAKGQKQVQKQLDLFKSGKRDASAERSRATMWDVCRFAEFHDYAAIIVENVVDARKWAMWDAWLHAMHLLGYMHECLYLNSMHCHPTPQSRDRMYIVFWKKGNKKPNLDYTPKAHCASCGHDVDAIQVWKNPLKKFGKYKTQYLYRCPVHGCVVEPYYYAAFNCIDWSIPGQRIGDRAKELAPNTVRRIQHGLDKFGKEPYIFHQAYSEHARGVVRSVSEPGFTQTTFQSQALIQQPFLADMSYLTNPDGHVKNVGETFPTQTTHQSQALIQPFLIDDKQTTGIDFRVRGTIDKTVNTVHTDPRLKLILPFITKAENSNNPSNVKSSADVMQTQTTTDSAGLVVPPFIVELKKTSTARQLTEPLSCATTVGYHGLITPGSMNAFLAAYNKTGHTTKHVNEVAPVVTTNDRLSLVEYTPKLTVEDCHYRMLKSHEIKAAMAFPGTYVICGSQKDQIKQLGNAVTPPAMKWLSTQVINSLS